MYGIIIVLCCRLMKYASFVRRFQVYPKPCGVFLSFDPWGSNLAIWKTGGFPFHHHYFSRDLSFSKRFPTIFKNGGVPQLPGFSAKNKMRGNTPPGLHKPSSQGSTPSLLAIPTRPPEIRFRIFPSGHRCEETQS